MGKPKLIQLKITKTRRGFHPSQLWYSYANETEIFGTLKQAKQWIKDTYKNHKRRPMFIDTKEGKSMKVGYVIGYKEEEYDMDRGHWVKFLENHWVSFQEVKDLEI